MIGHVVIRALVGALRVVRVRRVGASGAGPTAPQLGRPASDAVQGIAVAQDGSTYLAGETASPSVRSPATTAVLADWWVGAK
jgi:hypothetical protein